MCHSLKKVDSQNQKTNANQTFTQTGAYHEKAMDLYFKEGICGNPYLQYSAHISRH